MKNLFTENWVNAKLLVQPKELTVLNLVGDTLIQVKNAGVWLTHSEIPCDYVLQQGECLSLPAGLVLIQAVSDADAFVWISAYMPTSPRHVLWNGVKLWVKARMAYLNLRWVFN